MGQPLPRWTLCRSMLVAVILLSVCRYIEARFIEDDDPQTTRHYFFSEHVAASRSGSSRNQRVLDASSIDTQHALTDAPEIKRWKLLGIADSIYVISDCDPSFDQHNRRHDVSDLSWALHFPIDWIDISNSEEMKNKEFNYPATATLDEEETWEHDSKTGYRDQTHQVPNAEQIGMAEAEEAVEWRQRIPLPTSHPSESSGTGTDIGSELVSEKNLMNSKDRWHSHVLALREVIRKEDEVAIIFADDFDVEWDIEFILKETWEHLPSDWDIIYLGHCASQERLGDIVPYTSSLHHSTRSCYSPGYVINYRSAKMIYQFLRSSDLSQTLSLDDALWELGAREIIKLNSYTFSPPISTKTGQREHLKDSSIERLRMLQRIMEDGLEIPSLQEVIG
ncbi:hypothetical protein SISNIDRAFT_494577 [Sistotremastrum niveocremeum HHB9708]|uniref:Glycosyltransferase family 25 protein n=1 Tax=Sistotremastrum niveocremeum HHB9708 TaxID=1314777 RepID=A0A164WN23_9AGAM|nr:hypothetical protein SISNIDRAFT_494577 [Sistotremastrum niveocremeum HHB9708]